MGLVQMVSDGAERQQAKGEEQATRREGKDRVEEHKHPRTS